MYYLYKFRNNFSSSFYSYLKLNHIQSDKVGLGLRKTLQTRLTHKHSYQISDGISNQNLQSYTAKANCIQKYHRLNVLIPSPLCFLSRRTASRFVESCNFMSAPTSYTLNKDVQRTQYIHTSCRHYIRNVKLTNELKNLNVENDLDKLTKNLVKVKNHRTLPLKGNPTNELKDDINLNSSMKNEYFKEHPKNIINSFFIIVSQELGKDLKPTITYSKNLNDWFCTYHLKWPESVKITKRAANKKEASHKTVLVVLDWLRQHKKINSNGMPIIYDAVEMKNISRQNARKILHLGNSTMDKLNLIYEIHKNNFLKYIESGQSCSTDLLEHESVAELEDAWPLTKPPSKIMNMHDYLTNEVIKLPIQNFRNDIIELINRERIVIIKGETGCGKSIRVPQYVLEGWSKSENFSKTPCRILVTEPRRIAAISLAERVAYERQEEVGKTVGYQVRFKTKFSNDGHILYCTTGILLRRLQTDPGLSDCTHIILDEAHERDINTDLLMNLLQYALELNPALKLVIMSATINTNVFQEYFKGAAVFTVPGVTYPVQEHYIDSIETVDLRKTLQMCQSNEPHVIVEDIVKLIRDIHAEKPDGAILCFLPSWDDISRVAKALPSTKDMTVLRLHSKLDIDDQRKVFAKPPSGVRKVILSTNIAETSVTIDDVVYVIDTGIQKSSKFDAEKGIMCIDQGWVSQANIRQRKGRAGRVRPGESFHLYTKQQMENFIKFPIPEILRTSLTKIVLDSKVYSNNKNAIEFLSKLPTPPAESAIEQAVKELIELTLLDENENFTSLGKTLSNFQMEPRLAKAIADSVVFRCVTPIIDIVTLFSEETNIFSSALADSGDVKNTKGQFCTTSDHIAMVKIFEKWLGYIENGDRYMADVFCSDHNLRDYKLYTLRKLRDIYFDYIYKGFNREVLVSDKFSNNEEFVKAVLLSDAASVLRLSRFEKIKGRWKKKNVFLTRNNHKVNITSESVNSRTNKFPSEFLIYINETRSNIRRTTTVRETSFVSLLSLLLFKNEELLLKEIPTTEYSNELDSKDQVMLALENARIQCVCDRSHAKAILRCKEALQAGIIYYTSCLTSIRERDQQIDAEWEKMLGIVCSVLSSPKS